MSITGLAVRKQWFFSIYSIAHYMQDPPRGTVQVVLQGQEVSTITSVAFARALWSIWFGTRSVVDRNQLVHLVALSP